ncbi:MAG: 3-oxoacyl-[acyl-carrier protein] reductase [Chloroflexi bacterium]|jgi:3-oxoacyl-[acyl-carrier protein] reductase|nr:MAG: 3-oxoacyl-[acyl-carrier protein] reductase [Chloroflexota bacterium]
MTSAASSPNIDEHPMMGPGRGRLEGKVAVITGANSGIGRAAARQFAREGAKVVCVDLVEVVAPRIDVLIESEGGDAVFFQADVTSSESCQAMVALALERFGGLDVLVNNAGTGVFGRVDETSLEDWNRIIDINLNSAFLGSKAALPHMMEKGRGSIINTASTFGLLAFSRYAAYCASKAAVILLTRSMAIDYGPMGIRVNCLCPGATATDRMIGGVLRGKSPEEGVAALKAVADSNHALKRLANPEEIAYGMLFLASDEASFVTGHALCVDGGQTIKA